MANLDEVVIIDVSKWQGEMDWEKAKPKIHAAYIKALEGTTGIDPQFARNRAECERLGIPWSAYQFFKADKDAKKQAKNFAEMIGHYNAQGEYILDADLIPAVDVEYKPPLMTKQGMYNALAKFLNEFFVITGIYLIIYTRKSWWEANMPVTDFDNFHKLWVAHYNSLIEEPLVPFEWRNRGWTMWQWSADGNDKGEEYGAESDDIDLDRYKGGLEQIRRDYPNINWQPLPSPDPDPDPDPEPEPVMITIPVLTVVASNGVNVRNKPTVVGSTIYFALPSGSKVEVIEQMQDSGGNTWGRVGQQQYCAIVYNGVTYLA
jgi:GH25 family lysozyme M1 (1,4-beta-N-acetylmuramidase)